MRANWSDKALLRLQQVHDYIAQDQPINAQRFVDRLTRRADTIAWDPRAGRIVPKYRNENIRETFEGNYRIVYRVRSEHIDILTVRHGARLFPDHLRNL